MLDHCSHHLVYQESKKLHKQTLTLISDKSVKINTVLVSDSEEEFDIEEPVTKKLRFLDNGKVQSISFVTQNANETELVKCDHCPKICSKENLAAHVLTCEKKPLEPNQCEDCEHVFDNPWDLLKHQRLMTTKTRWA